MLTKQELQKLIDELPDELPESTWLAVIRAVRAAKSPLEATAPAPPPESIRELRDRLDAQRILIPSDGGPWRAEFADGRLETVDPVLQAFYSAPLDDEPLAEDDEAAIAEGKADIAVGRVTAWSDIKARSRGHH